MYNLQSQKINHVTTLQDYNIKEANQYMNSVLILDTHISPFNTGLEVHNMHTLNENLTEMMNHIYHPTIGDIQTYRKLMKDPTVSKIWKESFANELGKLAQGVGSRIKSGTDTIFFIPHHAKPKNRVATYGKIVCDYKEFKD